MRLSDSRLNSIADNDFGIVDADLGKALAGGLAVLGRKLQARHLAVRSDGMRPGFRLAVRPLLLRYCMMLQTLVTHQTMDEKPRNTPISRTTKGC